MKVKGKFTPVLAGAAFLLALAAGPLQAQQTGTVTGVVQDENTGQTLESAQVFISALNMGSLTNAQGRFLMTNVPAGQHQLQVELIGYGSATQSITVRPGQTTTVEFDLASTALRLQELVVTGVAGETPRVKLPFTVEKVDFTDMPVPSTSADGLIQAKVPGVRVVSGSGQPGEASSIMLRGPTSITGSESPLIIVDGVITDVSLADVDALDVQSVEIVKGAAAASLYGSRAQNGVIQIQTKRGAGLAVDQSRITFRNEYGQNDLESSIPLVDQHPYAQDADGWFLDGDGNRLPAECGSVDSGTGCGSAFSEGRERQFGYGPGVVFDCIDGTLCTNPSRAFQDNPFPLSNDPLGDFYDPGDYYSNYAAVEGKSGTTNYRASFTNLNESGVIPADDGYQRRNFRLNVDHQVLENLDISLNTYYSQSEQDDASLNGVFFSLTFMSPMSNLSERGDDGELVIQPDLLSLEDNPLYIAENLFSIDERQRFMGSLFARWSPLDWFDLEANYSIDRLDFNEVFVEPKGFRSVDGEPGTGTLSRENVISNDVNSSITASINYVFGDLTSRTKFRYLLEDQHSEGFQATGRNFGVNDVPVFGNTQQDRAQLSSFIQDVVAEGYFFISALDYQGKYIGDFLVRRDGSSLFGEDERWQTYYRASAAWRLAQESWWPFDAVDEFKLRYSIGTAGQRPGFSAQYEVYSVGGGLIRPVALGNPNLKPALTTEQEFGVEAVLMDDIGLGFTYATATTEDQILRVPLPSMAGFSFQWRNAGEIESDTYEAWIEASPLQRPDMNWTTRLNWDKTEQLITQLDVPPFFLSSWQFVKEGEELGAFYGDRWAASCSDIALYGIDQATCSAQFQVNDDGYLVWVGANNSFTEGVDKDLWGTASDDFGFGWGMPIASLEEDDDGRVTDFTFLGNITPDFNLSWSNTFRWRNLSLYTLFDWEQGAEIYNQTRQWAYREGRHEEVGQGGKPEGLKKPIAYYSTLYNVNDLSSHFVEDGSFVKLREISLRYTLDQSQLENWFGGIGLNQASINLIGRNLKTWTDFTGYDPEVGFGAGGSDAIGRVDTYQYPNFRTFTASLQLVF